MTNEKIAFLDAHLGGGGYNRRTLAAEYDRKFGKLAFEPALAQYAAIKNLRVEMKGAALFLKPKLYAHKIISSKPIPKPK